MDGRELASATCPDCGHANAVGSRFCAGCGTRLVATPVATGAGERRQLTVMFCDIVDSTGLSHRLDPEDFQELLRVYRGDCARVVAQRGGFVAQFLGDGILAYFGFPRAHEDDAPRAVASALDVLGRLPALNRTVAERVPGLGADALAVRIGIHTGVVVTEGRSGDRDAPAAVGETPNVAARLQGLAERNAVVISEATRRLVEGLFVFEPLGEHVPRGLTEPMRAWRVVARSAARSRLDARAAAATLTPLVGREQELERLSAAWRSACAGQTRLVLVSGEPGIGKSRLVYELRRRIADVPHAWIECRCSPLAHRRPLHPIVDMLRDTVHDAAEARRVDRLAELLTDAGFGDTDRVSVLAQLLSLNRSGEASGAPDPEARRRHVLDTLSGWVAALASREPIVAVIEDAHWIDPTTLELLERVLGEHPQAPLLLVVTARADFEPPWTPSDRVDLVRLGGLRREETARMIEALVAAPIEPALLGRLAQKTDGVPLFVEEVVRALRESEARGGSAGGARSVPDTLQDLLEARLDQLGPAKEIAQVACVIGREVPYDLLRAVVALDEPELERAVETLVAADLLQEAESASLRTLVFRHALVQDAAYGSVLRRRRSELHARVARVLEEQFGELHAARPELVAHHYTEAGEAGLAVLHWRQAAGRSLWSFATEEAIHLIEKALAANARRAAGSDRDRDELDLLRFQWAALAMGRGYATPAIGDALLRARPLAERIGTEEERFDHENALCSFYLVSGRCADALALGRNLIEMAGPLDLAAQAFAHVNAVAPHLYSGEYEQALELADRAVALREASTDPRVRPGTIEPRIQALALSAHALWHLGRADAGLERAERSLALARELPDPFALIFTQVFAARIYLLRGETEAAGRLAAATVALGAKRHFDYWLSLARMLHAYAGPDGSAAAVAELESGFEAFEASGAGVGRSYWLSLLADGYRRVGRLGEASAALAEARDSAEKRGEFFCDAELHRLSGELLLAEDGANAPRARAHFERALELARRRRALAWELRAATSLARLALAGADAEAACERLAAVYDRFGEGHDTSDLREARALLDAGR